MVLPLNVARANEELELLHLHLDSLESVITCRICKHALAPKSVSQHPGKHDVPRWRRAHLSRLIREFGLSDPSNLRLKDDQCLPHPHLHIRSGYRCKVCDERTTSWDLFKRHKRGKHGIVGVHTVDQQEQVFLQSWTKNGSSGFWIVKLPSAISRANEASLPRRILLERIHSEEEAHVRARRAEMSTDVGGTDMTLISNWMDRTGWKELFDGENRALLVALTQLPDTYNPRGLCLNHCDRQEVLSPAMDEMRLSKLLSALNTAFERCKDTAKHTSVFIRCWLRSFYPDRPYKAPFMLTGRPSSEKKYLGLLKRCVCFCVRFWRLKERSGVDCVRRSLNRQQCQAIEQVWHHKGWRSDGPCDGPDHQLQRSSEISLANEVVSQHRTSSRSRSQGRQAQSFAVRPDSDEDDGDPSDNSTDESDVPDECWSDLDNGCDAVSEPHEIDDASQEATTPLDVAEGLDETLADLALGFVHFLATEQYDEGRPSSTLLVYFSCVLGISPDGATFARPLNYTSHLSGLIYCIRLILLESSLPRFAHPTLGWPARPSSGQLERLKQMRIDKMCLGSAAPLDELFSLRAYGRSLSRSEGPSFRVNWSEDGQTISWENRSMTMNEFRSIGRAVLDRARWCCYRLMYGWNPPCCWSEVKDTLSNTQAGYSFVSDPANGLSDAYLELSRMACLATSDGLMTDNGWDYGAVRQYVSLHHELQRLIMLLVYLHGGSVPRGTDLLAVAHRNSPDNRRGVCIYADTIAIISQVNKARRTTNKEFYVVRFPDNDTTRIMYQELTYIRRFCCMLGRTCLESGIDSPLLFPSVVNPAEPCKTAELTKVLQEYTQKALGFRIGCRLFRQITIAITEKHVKSLSRPFDQYDDKSGEASLGVGFAWQSGDIDPLREELDTESMAPSQIDFNLHFSTFTERYRECGSDF